MYSIAPKQFSILFFFLLSFTSFASNPSWMVGKTFTIQTGTSDQELNLLITETDASGSGTGTLYVPFLQDYLEVQFEDFSAGINPAAWKGTIRTKNQVSLHDIINSSISSKQKGNNLPYRLNEVLSFQHLNLEEHDLWLTELRMEPAGMYVDLAFSSDTPEGQTLIFIRKNLFVHSEIPEFCGLTMSMEDPLTTNDPEFPITIKGSSTDIDSASYIEFNCDGFERFQLLCEYKFPENILKPANPTKDRVSAYFRIVSVKLGDFIGTVSVDPFEINGVDDFQFEIQNASVDYSTQQNDPGMQMAIDPSWPQNVRNLYSNATWRGFFLKELNIKLPQGFGASGDNRISIQIQNLIADHGNGISGSVNAQPNFNGQIEGWAISLQNLVLKIITNSPSEFRMEGEINVPVMTGTSEYTALVTFPANNPTTPGTRRRADISLTLTLDGTYSLPFLSNSSLVLNNGSTAEITYINGKFVPAATLHGDINISISNPSVEFPTLTFENFKINDPSIPATGPQGRTTGGLDRMSIGAFGIGGVSLTGSTGYNDYIDDATGVTGGPNAGQYQEYLTVNQGVGGNQKLAGFPIFVRDIHFGRATDGDKECYALDFTIGVNFASGSNAFNTSGMFTIWGNLDYNKLISSKPWEVLSYHKTTLEGISVEADLGKIKIAGGLRLITDDPVYGSGFKGAIRMDMKLPSAEFFVHSVAQFGSKKASGNTPDYRYFFVDAAVGFSSGLQLGNTGLAIYGFSGGFFYNMEKQGITSEQVAKNMNTGSMRANNPVNIESGNLLQPGVSLSGATYLPKRNTSSFNAGMIMGLSVPHTLLAEVQFGMEFNVGDGFPLRRIFFEGGAYAMNQGLTSRTNAAVVARLRMEVDLNNLALVGNFGATINAPFGAPADLALIRGTYNTNLSAVNLFFELQGARRFFIKVGTPSNPISVNFQLSSALKLGGINAYFMLGNVLDPIPTLQQIFQQEGYTLPSQLNVSRSFLSGDQGVAFGARLRIPRTNFKFLMFSASFGAMAGFDASLTKFSQGPTCGSNGTFGLNNWYLQGQAYGAFYGSLSMRINLFFYKKTVKIAELEAGAALMAQLPNPTYLMGFIYGRYSVLGGKIRGSFRFKVETGTKCDDLPDYNPVANIPLIQDVKPESGNPVEIYESPVATFFLPMGQQMTLSVIKDNGSEELRTYQCYIKEMAIRKKSNNQLVPATITYRDTFQTAVLEQSELLEPYTTYVFTLKASWHEWIGSVKQTNNAEEVRVVEFTTGGLPNRIVKEAVGYHAPGDRQRYWHKNYAQPMLEFKQTGWNHLFPANKEVSFNSTDQNINNAFQSSGWTVAGSKLKSANKTYHPSTNPYIEWKISKVLDVKYIMRLTNLKTNEKINKDLNGYPGSSFTFENAEIHEKGFADNYSNLYKVKYVKTVNSSGKQVLFSALNTLELEKKGIYHLEIVRVPSTPIRLPVSTGVIDMSTFEITAAGDTLATVETSSREISPTNSAMSTISSQLGEDVMYKDYYFGVSDYNSLADKFQALNITNSYRGISRFDFGHPDQRLLKVRWDYSTTDIYYPLTGASEPFDKYDQIKLRNNYSQMISGDFRAPLNQHIYETRNLNMLINKMVETQTASEKKKNLDRLKKAVIPSIAEMILNYAVVPNDLYNPYYNLVFVKGYLSGKSGFFINNSANASFWLDYGDSYNKTEANASGSTKIALQQWTDFVRTMIINPNLTTDWGTLLHFNSHFPATLSNAEITGKSMRVFNSSTWGSYNVLGAHSSQNGSALLVVQDAHARVSKNVLQLYSLHSETMWNIFKYGGSPMKISEFYYMDYFLYSIYYTRAIFKDTINKKSFYNNVNSFKQVWNEAIELNQSKVNNSKFGIELKSSAAAPLYMHSKVSGLSNTKSTSASKLQYSKK